MRRVLLDDLDKRILNVLQEDASISNQALAEKVFSSPPTCLRRVKRLEKAGIIQKRVTLLNAQALGSDLTAIVEINLTQQSAEVFDDFESLIVSENSVKQCYRVTSGPDFIVILQVPDMNAYHELVGKLFTATNHVRNVRTFFSTYRSKFDTTVTLA